MSGRLGDKGTERQKSRDDDDLHRLHLEHVLCRLRLSPLCGKEEAVRRWLAVLVVLKQDTAGLHRLTHRFEMVRQRPVYGDDAAVTVAWCANRPLHAAHYIRLWVTCRCEVVKQQHTIGERWACCGKCCWMCGPTQGQLIGMGNTYAAGMV